MIEQWSKSWNQRYRRAEYAYGIEPNVFFKEKLEQLQPASILLGAEGEGRNAVYAAEKGWNVHAFDISIEGKKKALRLTNHKNVEIDYQVGLLPTLVYPQHHFDVIALIFAHFPPDIRSEYHEILIQKLKQGGILILEAFSKKNLALRKDNPKLGGPPNLEALFSINEIKESFKDLTVLELVEKQVELNEGLYHNGVGSVIRFIGRKD